MLLAILGLCGLVWLWKRRAAASASPPLKPGLVRLHQFQLKKNMYQTGLSASPFCAKVEVFCRLTGIQHILAESFDTHPRTKKMPWIEYRPTATADVQDLPDSSAIINFLASEFKIPHTLSATDTATAHLLTRMMDEHLYWYILRSRWADGTKSEALLAEYYFGVPQWLAKIIIYVSGMPKTVWYGMACLARRMVL
jgi:hypothetical protein